MTILITGVTGFIGFHIALKLIEDGFEVIGVDNINNYYDQNLKKSRLKILQDKKLVFHKINLTNHKKINNLFSITKPKYVIHFAAQAGVRYSISNPHSYLKSNLTGFLNILECCRNFRVEHLIYASSSSVYGNNNIYPFEEKQRVDTPISFYAATKKSNEIMAYSYSHLYSLPTTGLRFFTVYGPWGRPDMAYFIFVKKILNRQPIVIYGDEEIYRDFTYIDDVTSSIKNLIFLENSKMFPANTVPHEIYNIGNSKPIKLSSFVNVIEKLTNINAIVLKKKKQAGDVNYTAANTEKLKIKTGFIPSTKIDVGMKKFIDWYKKYYNH